MIKFKFKQNWFTNRRQFSILNCQLICIVCLFCACSEEGRFDINSEDTVPPAAPVISGYEALNGAVRIFYTPPADPDVISIDARYTRKSDGQNFRFSTSYFANEILVPGLADTLTYDLELSAIDRAGNQSPIITYPVKPLESAILKVKSTMTIKGGFDAVFAKWTNELAENVNVFIDYSFTMNGTKRDLTRVFTSSSKDNRYYITDLAIPDTASVNVRFRVSDDYGNYTDYGKDTTIRVLKDMEVPKLDPDRNPYWSLPVARTIPFEAYGDRVRQVYGSWGDGVMTKVIDGIIETNENLNFMMAEDSHPWSLIIDLGQRYELSRIVTHQRHTLAGTDFTEVGRGGYYREPNIGRYNMYLWNDSISKWERISHHKIEMPQGTLSELEWNKLGRAGDMAYMYPDDPAYTKPTRWFRYEAISGFNDNYASGSGGGLSEITLYCKPITE
jgi:hypothetical protein